MAVYVDPVFTARPVNGFHQWCHCVADSEEELHEFCVGQLLLYRRYYQGDHYDLTRNKRKKAIQLGATEISSKEMLCRIRKRAKLLIRLIGKDLVLG